MTEELYYVVTPEVGDVDDLTGNKEVSIYQIVKDKPNLITSINVNFEDNSETAVEDYIWEMAPELFNETGDQKNFRLNQL